MTTLTASSIFQLGTTSCHCSRTFTRLADLYQKNGRNKKQASSQRQNDRTSGDISVCRPADNDIEGHQQKCQRQKQ